MLLHNSHDLFFRTPFGAAKTEDKVTLRIMTGEETLPSSVKLVLEGKDYSSTTKMRPRKKMLSNNVFETEIILPETPCVLWYYFELETEVGRVYYGNNSKRLGGAGQTYDSIPLSKYQITVYKSDYKTPGKLKGAVIYQIFPDRFFNGNPDEKINYKDNAIFHNSWDELPYYTKEQFGGEYLSNDFFGGNLAGIENKLEYLKELGVEIIYLNPVFKGFSNHRYDTGAYDEIDPVLGTNEDFERLCSKAKELEIGILLDGVFSHTGSDSMYFNKQGNYPTIGAYQSADSPYYSWYRFEHFPDSYECWWGIKTLPNVDEMNESYRKYILNDRNSIVKQWLRRGAKGFRLDVVDELPDEFLKELRRELKKENEDSIIIGEVWEDASNKESYGVLREYLLGDELDSVMNYPFRNAICDFLTEKIDAAEFNGRIMSLCENYPMEALYSAMNLLSSHDIMRIRHAMAEAPHLTREKQAGYYISEERNNLAKIRQKIAVILQMSLIGAPCIYYGDEVGMSGYEDPFNRQTFPWKYIDEEFLEFYKKIISLRAASPAMKLGNFKTISLDKHTYVFVRYIDKGQTVFKDKCENECVMIVINRDRENEHIVHGYAGEFGSKLTELIKGSSMNLEDGVYKERIEPLGFRIYKLE